MSDCYLTGWVASCCVFSIIAGVQISGLCMPYVDYLKFVTLFLIAFFAYESIIKGKHSPCGTDSISMWSSICASIIASSVLLVAICARLRGGMIANVAYIPMLCICCITICCANRLYMTKGPLSADFWNPTTLFTFKL